MKKWLKKIKAWLFAKNLLLKIDMAILFLLVIGSILGFSLYLYFLER